VHLILENSREKLNVLLEMKFWLAYLQFKRGDSLAVRNFTAANTSSLPLPCSEASE
jgi:hypothetical protein